MKDIINTVVSIARVVLAIIILLLVIGFLDVLSNPYQYLHHAR